MNGTQWTTHANQTVDIKNVVSDACYEVLESTATQAPHEGKREVKAIDCSLTSIEDTSIPNKASSSVRKILRDGQLLLFYNNRVYTLLGIEN